MVLEFFACWIGYVYSWSKEERRLARRVVDTLAFFYYASTYFFNPPNVTHDFSFR